MRPEDILFPLIQVEQVSNLIMMAFAFRLSFGTLRARWPLLAPCEGAYLVGSELLDDEPGDPFVVASTTHMGCALSIHRPTVFQATPSTRAIAKR